MRVPVSWLRDYVALEMPLEELSARLSVASAEIEGIEQTGLSGGPENAALFRVGRVLEVSAHPNADRVRLTRVDVGEREPRAIVCGASNVEAGATVGVALPGAVVAGGLRIEPRTVRGERSDGMIVSEQEIGIDGDASGIMLLPEAPPAHRSSNSSHSPTACSWSRRRETAPTCSRSTGSRVRSRRSTGCRSRRCPAGRRRVPSPSAR